MENKLLNGIYEEIEKYKEQKHKQKLIRTKLLKENNINSDFWVDYERSKIYNLELINLLNTPPTEFDKVIKCIKRFKIKTFTISGCESFLINAIRKFKELGYKIEDVIIIRTAFTRIAIKMVG